MTDTSYISSVTDWDSDRIMVWERPVTGGARGVRMHKPPRYFYVPDEEGTHTSIYGDKLRKLSFESADDFKAGLRSNRVKFESDIQPEARLLMDEYYGRPTPVVHYAFLDIEVDYSSKLGWSSPKNPYAAINAITIYQSWTGEYLTYAVPPKGWNGDHEKLQADLDALWVHHNLGFKKQVTICASEKDLLLYMLGDIEDADIISGWNSEFFDNPYIIKRLEAVLGKRGVRGMCFPGAPEPREKLVNRFGTEELTYQLYGRTHLDYLDLFKKFTFEGRTSYSLANITADELDTPKLDYPGTLEELYNNDFAMFIAYNSHDVGVLVQLDKKYNLMQLVNQMAHENTVPFLAILGTVRYVETGIINRTHRTHNLICADKNISGEKNEKVEGAIVMTPRAGLHWWLGSVDLTSLYPSVARALNMSIETFVGQFVQEEKAWAGIRAKDHEEWDLIIDGQAITATGGAWHDFLRAQNYAISAFGTVFDQNKPGMVADTLTFWFTERKRLQAEKKRYTKEIKAFKELCGPEPTAEQSTELKRLKKLEEDFDLLQLTKKIQLNSAYGALLNENFRWGRREIGASITGTGRQITTHMCQTIGTVTTGRPVKLEKRFEFGTHDRDGNELRNNKSPVRRGANQGRKATEPFAEALLDDDMEYLLALPTEPQYIYKKDKETGAKYLVSTPAIYWPMYTDQQQGCAAIIYGDTDSISGDSMIQSNRGITSVEQLFKQADNIRTVGDKQFAQFDKQLMALGYDHVNDAAELQSVLEIYRHKVTKRRYNISLSTGQKISVTGDHSLMVERDKILIEIKPGELQDGDIFLCAKYIETPTSICKSAHNGT